MPCSYPHCCCALSCTSGGVVPQYDPKVPLFGRGYLTKLADRYNLALKFESDPGFRISEDDLRAIVFSLRFTAERLS
jgi:hypothetical protein